MDSKGQHLIVDAFNCQHDILNDAEQLKEVLIKAIDDIGMEILSVNFHSFSPQGVTGVIGISTSHFSIHTWPEKGYAALDLYTCGEQDIWPAFKDILQKIKAKRVEVFEVNRGEEVNQSPVRKILNLTSDTVNVDFSNSSELFQLRDDQGNVWDLMQLKELALGKHDILYHGSSPFQDILLVKANDVRLYLNQELQFCSLDERYYHEALIYPVMEMAASHERVLILGGGDGLALREVLKYSGVEHVDLVDIDPVMLQLSKTEPVLLEQNNQSFFDARVHAHTMDAKKYITGNLKPYNVIIIDFPDPTDPIISALYTKELFSQIASHLTDDGVLVCQSNSPEDAPKAFWSIAKTFEEAGLFTKPYNIIVPSFGLWGFHLASHRKFTKKIPQISVPHQAIQNMEPLFEISSNLKSFQGSAIVNTKDNLRLHELYQEEINSWS
ncbi:adenosylmethionine decarboxylase [Neobacillus vireti]|uniref:adenosylmethionine decarboxylase n=1 Tax=Neobacillus vireti TaxID=220686 RepID=UPI002FFFA1C1